MLTFDRICAAGLDTSHTAWVLDQDTHSRTASPGSSDFDCSVDHAPLSDSSGELQISQCKDFRRCGTYGCDLRDNHIGLHEFPPPASRRFESAIVDGVDLILRSDRKAASLIATTTRKHRQAIRKRYCPTFRQTHCSPHAELPLPGERTARPCDHLVWSNGWSKELQATALQKMCTEESSAAGMHFSTVFDTSDCDEWTQSTA